MRSNCLKLFNSFDFKTRRVTNFKNFRLVFYVETIMAGKKDEIEILNDNLNDDCWFLKVFLPIISEIKPLINCWYRKLTFWGKCFFLKNSYIIAKCPSIMVTFYLVRYTSRQGLQQILILILFINIISEQMLIFGDDFLFCYEWNR